jgi:ankyrin repeat protein
MDRQIDLMTSVYSGQFRRVRRLIDGGLDVDTVNSYGQTPLLMVVRGLDEDRDDTTTEQFVLLLLTNGAKPNAKDNAGWTSLMYACQRGVSLRLIDILIQFGADPLQKNHSRKIISRAF